jgi:hypothetical protein
VIGYAAGNPAFAKAFRARIADGQRVQLSRLLQSAINKGELRSGLDMDMALDVLLGPILYLRFMQAPVPLELPQHVVDSFWRLNAQEPSARPEANGDSRNGSLPAMRPTGASKHLKPLRRRVR